MFRARRPRRHGPILSARGFAFLLNGLTVALLAATVAFCLRS